MPLCNIFFLKSLKCLLLLPSPSTAGGVLKSIISPDWVKTQKKLCFSDSFARSWPTKIIDLNIKIVLGLKITLIWVLKGLTIRNRRVRISDSKHPSDYLRHYKNDGGGLSSQKRVILEKPEVSWFLQNCVCHWLTYFAGTTGFSLGLFQLFYAKKSELQFICYVPGAIEPSQ